MWPHPTLFPPQLWAFLGFLTSALWINTAATEVVNILRCLGVVSRLSNTVLGLTLLAWGNSIGGEMRPGGASGLGVCVWNGQHALHLETRHPSLLPSLLCGHSVAPSVLRARTALPPQQ